MSFLELVRHIGGVLARGIRLQGVQLGQQRSHSRIDLEFDLRDLDLDFLLLELPAHSDHNRAFVHRSTNVLVDEPGLLDRGVELVVQEQLVLLSCLSILPGLGLHVEKVGRAQERFAQGGVSPLCLLADQLRLDRGGSLHRLDLGLAGDIQILEIPIHLLDLSIVHQLRRRVVFLQLDYCRCILPRLQGNNLTLSFRSRFIIHIGWPVR